MKRSEQPTDYILLRARTNSGWDACGYALIHVTPDWIESLYKRLRLIQPFIDDQDFKSHVYRDTPLGFFDSPSDIDYYLEDELLKRDEDWTFVLLDGGEPDSLPVPTNPMDGHIFIIYKDGTAMYRAYGKHSFVEFWSENFDVANVLSLTLNRTL